MNEPARYSPMISQYEQLAGQVIMAGFQGAQLPRSLSQAIEQQALAGIILFKRNLGSMSEISTLIHTAQSFAEKDMPLLIGVDQEGGRVARLGPPILKLPPMSILGQIDDVSLTERAAEILGHQLSILGFNLNFAPVLDVNSNSLNPVIGDRAFGSTPEVVIRHGIAFAKGLTKSGIIPCGKHFPGHGDTDLDSHLDLPIVKHDDERMTHVELKPFQESLEWMPTMMSAHVVFEILDKTLPATLSRKVMTDLLREKMKYKGLIISDDLEMKAVSDRWGISQAAIMAIEAGCDLLLICSDIDAMSQARLSIAEKAEKNKSFYQRLCNAVDRNLALRKECLIQPNIHQVDELYNDIEARSFEKEIEKRLETL